MMGKKWRIIGGVSGFIVGGGIAVAGLIVHGEEFATLGFVAVMAGGAIGLMLGWLAFLMYSNRSWRQFSIRDFLLVTVIVAVCVAWWVDRQLLVREIQFLTQPVLRR